MKAVFFASIFVPIALLPISLTSIHSSLKSSPKIDKFSINELKVAQRPHSVYEGDWPRLVKEITIGIGTPSGTGSGVIIGKKGQTYTALTSRHVIPSFNKNDEYEVYSPYSKQYYIIENVDYPSSDDVDIIVIQFKSSDQLKLAVINDFYNQKSFLPIPTTSVAKNWNVESDGVRGGGISMPTKSVTVPIFRFTEAALLERAIGNQNGYELLYQASTVPGMSGGPLVGWRNTPCGGFGYFSLMAIHGRSEGYDQGGGRSGISLAVPVDLISPYLKNNAQRYGISVTPSATQDLARQNYC